MKNFLLTLILLATAVGTTLAQVTVTAAVSANGTTVHVVANAASSHPITGWHIYADSRDVYSNPADVTSISTDMSLTVGTHSLVVRAWDASGAYGSKTLAVTTTTGTTGSIPPASATAIRNLEDMSGWGNCATASCAGSSNKAAYWMAQFNGTPSLNGNSTHFYVNGSAYSTVLWWKNLPKNDAISHFVLDYNFYLDTNSVADFQALEFDFIQVVNGRKYNFSSECDKYGAIGSHWDTWHEQNGATDTQHWIHTNIPCPVPAPGVWHNVKLYGERVGTTTHYVSITMDGKTYPVPSVFTNQTAPLSNWTNRLTFQVQLDLASKGGILQEWVDGATLYVW